MCPVCITAAVVIAGKIASTGGLTAMAIRKVGGKNAVNRNPDPKASIEDHHDQGIFANTVKFAPFPAAARNPISAGGRYPGAGDRS